MIRVLFVCTSNVCRSPLALRVARHLAAQSGMAKTFRFDSAGTHGGLAGDAMDRRAKLALERQGYPTPAGRSRKITAKDFDDFDLILAMDGDNLKALQAVAPINSHAKLKLLLDFATSSPGGEIPDPYYGPPEGFDRVLDLCELGIRGLLRAPAP